MKNFKKCWSCGSKPIYKKHRKMSGFSESVNCSNENCYVHYLSIDSENWNIRYEQNSEVSDGKDDV